LEKKEKENKVLKSEIEKVLVDQMKTLNNVKKKQNESMSMSVNYDITGSQETISELTKKIEVLQFQLKQAEEKATGKRVSGKLEEQVYNEFNGDLKSRLQFVRKVMDFS